MSHLTGIRFTNWLCYRGEHEIELGPGVFALVAERDGDPARSNAVGKSAFLRAIRFVLTGDHPRQTEDQWITDGETEGGVDVEISSGAFFSRWRRRGDATRLKVVLPEPDPAFEDGRMLELHGDQAQAAIDRIVGFSPREQKTTWWCDQGQADAFVNGDASEATLDIVRWCGVEPVRRACMRVAEELRDLVAEDARQAMLHADSRMRILRELGIDEIALVGANEEELVASNEADGYRLLKDAQETIEILRLSAEGDATAKQKAHERARLGERAKKYDEYAAAVVDAEQRLASLKVDDSLAAQLEADEKRLRVEAEKAEDVVRQKAVLARGEFDGICPVGGIECPAKTQLNNDAACARLLVAEAEVSRGKVLATLTTAAAAAHEAREDVEARDELQKDIKYGRARMNDFKAERDAFLALEAVEETGQASDLEQKLGEVRTTADVLRRRLYNVRELRERMLTAEAAREVLQARITGRREALQILGPSGAQRRLVEGFLSRVETAANEDLVAAGVDVRVVFHWQRELKDLADTCSQCGSPFPSSRKVRSCPSCSAARGQKIEQKFRCEVSPKSGGMDALAGVGVRFSAGAWLRARRGSSWSVACLDEPLAAVDAHNRALVGRHLAQMLSVHYGIDQAFISDHRGDFLDMLPRRIVVKGTDRGTTIEVRG